MTLFQITIYLSVSTIVCTVSSNIMKSDGYPVSENNFLSMFESESVDEELIAENSKKSYNTYCLYTRTNPHKPEFLEPGNSSTIEGSNFNITDVTVFLVHGWNGHGWNIMNILLTKGDQKEKYNKAIAQSDVITVFVFDNIKFFCPKTIFAFLRENHVNVIVVDWSKLANKNYITAKLGVPDVGRAIGQFINWLVTLGVHYDTVHLVGFSLGAHVVGNAGRETNSRVRRITGLDPGGPLWKNDKNRLISSDAKYVEVIHTNTALYGYGDPCGDADFYPNGGYKMPDCILHYCSHRRSYEYMATTLQNNRFLANECNNLQEVLENTCIGTLYPMGSSDLTKSRSGIFRVNT